MNASVCDSEGDVWDGTGNLYRMNTWVRHPVHKLEAWCQESQGRGIRHYNRLASAVHRVSFMYFHFMTEALPRIAKLAPHLVADPELKLLTYGGAFERAWIQKLGIRSQQLVAFDPLFAYHADELLVTNPVEIARTPREDLRAMLGQLGLPEPPPPAERNDLVYVSRRLANDRLQTNEESLLDALRAEAPALGLRLVVHDGNPGLTPDDTVAMFRRARVVMGPNGAGLAHMLFAPPGTALIELMFINNTGMDLWHLANALNQSYYMVPMPRSFWLDPGSDVPIEQAVATLRWALGRERAGAPACAPGLAPKGNGDHGCAPCPPGTFSTGYDGACLPCSPGWVAEGSGGDHCSICTTDSYAPDATRCVACPAGTLTAMPGSTKPEECLDPVALERVKGSWMPVDQVVAKVSAYFLSYQAAVRRSVGGNHLVRFDALPVRLKDRVLSELDVCTRTQLGSQHATGILSASASCN
ncbi:hypothetical protein GPECTOR_11g308 [Gonium pectorale]|uniref:Glycosyltransferase 61 catalytic domain-containing protein n=1 Tax=Gonium pectorale TaxID=33097 RepID=A0A150GQ55_GONPE|nr:hypothetical protein GPECTOR_11g308 [Gonium pectorale]|eukprot:KXZ51872.1 hypothetical protein GPECTOR_11g308 [Gonium pectorale]